jgi:hypothetical protein
MYQFAAGNLRAIAHASTAGRAVPGQDWPQGNLYNDRRTHLNRRAKAGGDFATPP